MTNTNELTAKLKAEAIKCSFLDEVSVDPGHLLALIEALEAAEKRNARQQEVITNQDKWINDIETTMISAVDRAEAAEKRIAEQREYYESVIADGSKRIASLEARTLTVKLPSPHAHLIWIRAGRGPDDYWDDVAVSDSKEDRCCDGSERYAVYSIFEIQDACAAAGIKLQIEGE